MKLYNDDCLSAMNFIPDNSVDMVLCDLPYGTTSKNKWDIIIPLDKLWKQYDRVVKDNGAILLFSQMPFGASVIISNPKNFRYEWIWEKSLAQGFLNANRMPMRSHENILVFYKKLPTYNPQKEQGLSNYNKGIRKGNNTSNYSDFKGGQSILNTDGSRFPRDVIYFGNANHKNILHPTQKPVDLLEYLVKTYTNKGEVVLDNCMGSGSTGVACLNTGRDFIGIEKDEKYFKIAEERLNSYKNGLTN